MASSNNLRDEIKQRAAMLTRGGGYGRATTETIAETRNNIVGISTPKIELGIWNPDLVRAQDFGTSSIREPDCNPIGTGTELGTAISTQITDTADDGFWTYNYDYGDDTVEFGTIFPVV